MGDERGEMILWIVGQEIIESIPSTDSTHGASKNTHHRVRFISPSESKKIKMKTKSIHALGLDYQSMQHDICSHKKKIQQ